MDVRVLGLSSSEKRYSLAKDCFDYLIGIILCEWAHVSINKVFVPSWQCKSGSHSL